MAGKRKVELFIEINNEKEFQQILKNHADQFICAEIYCSFAGQCTVMGRLFTKVKLEWSNGEVVLLKVPADEIEALDRFKGNSEPVYMFIVNHKVTKVFRGVNSLQFADLVKEELKLFELNKEFPIDRPLYEINEPTPDETEWLTRLSMEKNEELMNLQAKREARQVARKRHRAERMVPHLKIFNFVLFWPHCLHAHPELYGKWDANNIIMVGREEIHLTEELALDVFYAGDAPVNEASMHKLLSGPALAICFRLLDTDKHFITLVRRILYEDLPQYDETKPAEEQLPRMTPFNYYKSFSPTREEIMKKRQEERERRRADLQRKRARRLSEMQRLARQAIADELEARKTQKEQLRLELLKSGNLASLKELDETPDNTEVDIEIPEELPRDVLPEDISDEEDENEYFPPPGLLIPGFYSPPNDIAKVNGLAILFPRIISDYVVPESEFLPPHLLITLEIQKRYKAIEALVNYKKHIIHMGIFRGSSPFDSIHIAYSVKEYDTLDNSQKQEGTYLAFMMSIETDVPLLQFMELTPLHVSRDNIAGEDECAALFPVDYADDYPELEDFE